MFTPAFSVKTVAWRALASSQSPNVLPPVKSISFTMGCRASAAASLSAGSSAASVARLGSKPASVSTSWQTCTVIASGSTAPGCGLTITGFPVTSEANRPGHEFQVGNVLQPITSARPRGTAVYVFSIRSGSPATRLLPERRRRDPAHLLMGVGDRLQRTVERVRAAGLEGHHERLPAGVLDGVGELEHPGMQAVEDLQADTDPGLRTCVAPLPSGPGRPPRQGPRRR